MTFGHLELAKTKCKQMLASKLRKLKFEQKCPASFFLWLPMFPRWAKKLFENPSNKMTRGSLNVVFVAMIVGITKRKFDPQTLAAAVLAVAGVGFLELAGSQQFVIGDLISLAQPIGFGMGYIRLEEIMAESPKDALPVTAVKLTMVALASWAYFAVTAGTVDLEPVLSNSVALTGVLYTGLVTTALALLVESVAFRFVDAASASVIFTTEPLWAAIFAVWLINEPFSSVDAVGGALVISANIIKELPSEYLPWNTEEDKP